MMTRSYVSQLRQLRQVERERNIDLTDRAMIVLGLRLDTINSLDIDPSLAQFQRDDAMRMWELFMQREIPARG